MAKLPVEIIIKAIDKAGPAFKSLAARMKAAWGEGKFKAWYGLTALKEHLAKNFKPLDMLKSGLKGLGVGVAALTAGMLASGVGFLHFIGNTTDALDALRKMSDEVGLSADTFAGLRYSAKLSGVSAESFARGIAKLNKSMGEMSAGKGEFLAFLNKAAPDLAKQVKGAKTTEQAVSLLADAFARLPDTQRRAALANAAFGESGTRMGEWLHAGGPAVQKQMLRYLQLAGSQDEAATAAAALGDAWGDTQTALEGLRTAVASKFFPVLTDLANRLATFLSNNREGIAQWAKKAAAAVQAWVDSGGLERLIDGVGRLASSIVWLVEKLGPTGTALVGFAALAPGVVTGLLSISGTVLSLAASALPALASGFMAVAPAIYGALAPLLPFIAAAGALGYLGKTIYDNWDELSFIFRDWGNSLRWAIIDTWAKVRPILEKLSSLLGPIMGGGVASALQVGDAVVGKLTPGSPSAAVLAAATGASGETRVVVDFANAPRGTRVSQESSGSQSVDLSVGYSMASGISG